MARKRQQNEEEKQPEDTNIPSEDEENSLLKDEETPLEGEISGQTTPSNASDTLGHTLENLNKNMGIMAEAMTSMHKAIKRMADPRENRSPKRRKIEMSDSDSESSKESGSFRLR